MSTAEQSNACDPRQRPATGTIDEEAFRSFMSARLSRLLQTVELCPSPSRDGSALNGWNRLLLGEVLASAAQLEECLDSYGAQRNDAWFVLREYMAGANLFSSAAYKLLHLRQSYDRYALCSATETFRSATDEAAAYTCGKLACILRNIREYALGTLGIPAPPPLRNSEAFTEESPVGLLPATRPVRHVDSAVEAAVQVATSFLQRSVPGDVLHLSDVEEGAKLVDCVPDPINEEVLSSLETTFHNMQRHYDTHIADTDTEHVDTDLPPLRGHVSVVFHLLETAVLFLHFYERHLARAKTELPKAFNCPVDSEQLLDVAFSYSIYYARTHLEAARNICRGILKRYAEITEVDLPVPRYRGFHVRPSTLIARIVRHYGSEVSMTLFSETYDGAKPLELFRANEQINAVKRRKISERADGVTLKKLSDIEDVKNEVRRVVLELAEADELIIYEHPLPIEELETYEDELLSQYVHDQTALLMARGAIDVEADIQATFRGDKRVLADIRELAENGYGEDRFGNNVPLPNALSYLHRD